jgi:cytochrome P450
MTSLADLPLFDLQDAAFQADPHGTFGPLLAQGPLARTRRGIEVLSHDWNYRLYAERRLETPGPQGFIEKGVPPVFREFLENGFLLGFHGETHDLVRRVIQKGFTIREAAAQRGMMRALAHQLIDGFDPDDTDFVRDFSMRFPTMLICRMLGVPDADIARFKDAAVVLHKMGSVPLAPGFPFIEQALGTMRDYVAELVALRRAKPQEDFVSALIEAQESEGRLTESELVWNIVNLLFAGQDTTRFQLAGVVRAAIEQPGDAWERLASDPSLVGKVMWEGMRFHPTVKWSTRRPLEDFTFDGFHFERGQWVFLSNHAATRDPSAFPDPHRYDIDREQSFTLPFGRGLHHCVGQMLARNGMEEALLALSQRLAGLRLAGDVIESRPTSMVGGPEAMPVRFDLR